MGLAEDSDLDRLVARVIASPRYRTVIPELVRSVGARELAHRPDWKAAVKATKGKLHQVAGAFCDHGLDYARGLTRLADSVTEPTALKQACIELMAQHASTRERLAVLDEFYGVILGDLPPPSSVLDVACGLHPLSIPWMSLAPNVQYCACDVLTDLTDFLTAYLRLLGIRGQAHALDVTRSLPRGRFDVALVLKSIPCLEQLDQTAGQRLLDSIRADCIIVSFPVRSLGGRSKGMATYYERHLRSLIERRPWRVAKYEFVSELVFRLETPTKREQRHDVDGNVGAEDGVIGDG